jgi:hypothetical protein
MFRNIPRSGFSSWIPQRLIIKLDKASQEVSEVYFFYFFKKGVLPKKNKIKRDKRETDQRWTIKNLRSSTKLEIREIQGKEVSLF